VQAREVEGRGSPRPNAPAFVSRGRQTVKPTRTAPTLRVSDCLVPAGIAALHGRCRAQSMLGGTSRRSSGIPLLLLGGGHAPLRREQAVVEEGPASSSDLRSRARAMVRPSTPRESARPSRRHSAVPPQLETLQGARRSGVQRSVVPAASVLNTGLRLPSLCMQQPSGPEPGTEQARNSVRPEDSPDCS
jgi:hypothetical protein